MKLNYECLLDIMISLEGINEVQFRNMSSNDLKNIDILSEYSDEDLLYCCIKLFELKFINLIDDKVNRYTDNIIECYIKDITPIGHKFLFNYHDFKEHDNTKDKIINFVSAFAYDVSVQTASTALASFINK